MSGLKKPGRRNVELQSADLSIGTTLRALRKREGVSQQTLAHVLGVTFQQVQKYERGANRISAASLFEICKYFNVSPMAFAGGSTGMGTAGDLSVLSNKAIRCALIFDQIESDELKKAVFAFMEVFAASAAKKPGKLFLGDLGDA